MLARRQPTDGSQKYPGVLSSPIQTTGALDAQTTRLCVYAGENTFCCSIRYAVPCEAFNKMIAFMETHPLAGLAGPEQRDGAGKINFSNLVHWSPREMVNTGLNALSHSVKAGHA